MKRDKALLPWRSRSLVEHVAAQVASAAGNVALIGDPQRYGDLGLACFPDLRPGGMGPLAGIEAALETKRGELNLTVACDMPGVETSWLATLLDEARMKEAQCVATRERNGVVHPLCAVYRNSCLPKVRSALDAGRLKLLDLLEELQAVTLEIGKTIWNINTPEEWSDWQLREKMSEREQAGADDAS
jgi:molybdenum cofactor guanylyltransferase